MAHFRIRGNNIKYVEEKKPIIAEFVNLENLRI